MRRIFGPVVRTLRSPINRKSESIKDLFAVIFIISLFFLLNASDFGIAKAFLAWMNGSTWGQPGANTTTRVTAMKIDFRPTTKGGQLALEERVSSTDRVYQSSTSLPLTSIIEVVTQRSTRVQSTSTTTTEKPVILSKIHYKHKHKGSKNNHPKVVPKVTFYGKSEVKKAENNTKTVKVNTLDDVKGELGGNGQFNPLTVFRDGDILNLAQNDSKLIDFIRKHHLTPPSKMPYKSANNAKSLASKSKRTKSEATELNRGTEWKLVLGLLENMTKGFFIECGGNYDKLNSNTFVLERDYGWTGLLIEPDHVHLAELLEEHRKAWVATVCLSKEPYPQVVTLRRWNKTVVGEVQNSKNTSSGNSKFNASCLPLFSILSAIDKSQVDFFKLDVGMSGLAILKTIPFESVSIKIIIFGMSDALMNIGIPFVESKGYVCLLQIRGQKTNDYMFIQRTLYKTSMGQNCFKNEKPSKKKRKGHRHRK